MNIKKYLSIAVLTFLTISKCHASKILAVFVFPGKSHFMMHQVLVQELLKRGHEITCIAGSTLGKNLGANYTEILLPPYDFWKEVGHAINIKTIFDLAKMGQWDFLKMLDTIGIKTTEKALQQPAVHEIFNRNETKNVYDLLLVEQFYQEAFLTLALKYDIPIIASSTLGHQNFMSQMMGVITPWSFVPHGSLPLSENMNFWERAWNSAASLYDDYYREFIYYPKQDVLIQKYLSHLPIKFPTVSEMKKNLSVLFLNSYVPLASPRPSTIGMVEIGGMHIYPPKPLPTDIKAFLDGATNGAIYFSLGSQVQSSELSPEKLKIFFDTFSKLKQRVLWKFEDESLTGLPKNVMIKKWMPQGDVLAHPNVKVFITHGGLFGSQEGVFYGIPMLGIPIYCDQHLNINKAVASGYALKLNFDEITGEQLEYSLRELLENPSYRNKVKEVSEVFRDRQVDARESAMYWIEYVIRHKGARHIRSAGLDLTWYQYYLVDVIGFFALIVFGTLAALIFVIRTLLGGRKVGTKKQKVN